jgi:predicted kinase
LEKEKVIKLKELLFEGVYDPGILKAVFLAGGPGSGKSFVAMGLFGIPENINVSPYGLKMINQDTELESFLKKYGFGTDLDAMPNEVFRQLTDPGYQDYSGMRSHSKALSKERLRLYTQGRLGVIIDGTGHKFGAVKKEKKMLEDKGYDTFMTFVHTDLDIAQERNMSRSRKLNPEIVEKYWQEVQHNKATFQGLFGNVNFLLVDNSKVLDEKQAKKKFDMLIKKGIDKFIKHPVKNYIGKKWIEKQKLLKAR